MTKPFRPPRGITVETPYRISVLRADPDFEYAKRHEPFYEFSNGRRFNEDTSRQGAYLIVRHDQNVNLIGVAGLASAGNVAGQGDQGIIVDLVGVGAAGVLGPLGFTNVTPALPLGVQAAGAVGTITISGSISASFNLTGLAGSGLAGTVAPQGQTNVSANLVGVAASGVPGLINNRQIPVIGVAAAAQLGTITAQIGSQSASPNVIGVRGTGAIGTINQGQLQQPVMSLTSGFGVTNPTFTFTLDASIAVGDTMRFEEQVAGGDWSTPVVDVTHTFTLSEIGALEVDLLLAALTNGNYEARMRVTKGAVDSAWSNSVPFTVSVASSGTPFGLLLAITK